MTWNAITPSELPPSEDIVYRYALTLDILNEQGQLMMSTDPVSLWGGDNETLNPRINAAMEEIVAAFNDSSLVRVNVSRSVVVSQDMQSTPAE